MAEIHSKRIDEQSIDTLIEDDVTFWGEATLSKNLAIKGKFYGSINSDDDIYIDKQAVVEADIVSHGAVYVQGRVKGNIDAVRRVELASECSVNGDVTTERMVIENDCEFNGSCKMRKPSGAA
jgi:cytoskeletal protein CcmA (bactofilin family)